jgi:hypothetical protein
MKKDHFWAYGFALFFLFSSGSFAQNLEEIKRNLKGDRKVQTEAFKALLELSSKEAYELHASHFAGENSYHRDKSYEFLTSISDTENGAWLTTLPSKEKDPYARKLFVDLLVERAEKGMKDSGLSEELLKLAEREKDPLPLGITLRALGKLKIMEGLELVRKRLKSVKHPRVRAYAYEALARLGGKAELETLKESINDKEYETQVYCVKMFAEFARDFGPRSYHNSDGAGKAGVSDPSKLQCPRCKSPMQLVEARGNKEAFYGCTKFRSENCKGRIELTGETPKEKKKREEIPESTVDPELRTLAIDLAIQLFKDADKDKSQGWRLKAAALDVLGTYPHPKSINLLLDFLRKEHEGKIPALVARTLYQITDKDLGESPKIWESWWKVNQAKWEPPLWGYDIRESASKGKTLASYYGIDIVSDRIAFLLDGSGSMKEEVTVSRKAGTSGAGPSQQTFTFLERAKQELFRTTKELAKSTPKARAQIIFFQEELLIFSPKGIRPLKASLKEIENFLEKIQAEKPGNMLGAIQTAMADPEVDTLFLLSDGAPSAGLHTIKEPFLKWIEEENRFRNIQFFGIIIGASVRGKSIMLELTNAHNGKAIEDDLVLRE